MPGDPIRIIEDTKVVSLGAVRARRRIADHFYGLHAFEPGKSIEFAPQSSDEIRQFDELRADGVIRQHAPGHYWFDLDVYRPEKKKSRRRILPYLAAGLLVAVWAWALFFR